MENDQATLGREEWTSGEHPASFSGQTIFLKNGPNINRNVFLKEVFPKLITYQKFRAAKEPSPYNPYFVRTIRKVIQSDIIFMNQPASMVKQNNGYQYILIVEDVFSRKIWAHALKKKNAASVLEKLKVICNEMKPFHSEARLVIDRGTEYLNNSVTTYLNSNGISITHPSDGHASHVERANLSLQRILYQYMMQKGGARKWVDFLQKGVNIMNMRHHRIIRMTPNQAEMSENREKVNEAMSLYRQKANVKQVSKKGKKQKNKFSIGDRVRIKKEKKIFSRGYLPTFTDEVFIITHILNHLPITMYTISEWDGSIIQGNFYPEELSLVKEDVFKVEKILRRAIKNGVPSAYVKWEGYPNRYNNWIPIANFK